jgi:LPPG:FO 2-phospho-L-lactate transferase
MKIAALAGGVGGAKLAHGLSIILPPEDLCVVVNTGDDFEHLGLAISPDLDTVCYTIAGFANPETGWGRMNETWNTISNIEKLGGPGWFRLGDQDLATHLERTRRLKDGQTLSKITKDFCAAWGVKHSILPMSDDPVHTYVLSDEGDLPFQEYFVHRKCQPRVRGFKFLGIENAQPVREAVDAINTADAIVICPSNPWVSIDPILQVLEPVLNPEIKVLAVSPIISGQAVKGPAAKMFAELGLEPSAATVAAHYKNILRGFVLDDRDNELVTNISVQTLITNTYMNSIRDRVRLAEDVLHFAGKLI